MSATCGVASPRPRSTRSRPCAGSATATAPGRSRSLKPLSACRSSGVSEGTATPLRRTSVALMGGLRASGRVRVEDRIVRVTTLGGMDLDLGEAEFIAPRVTIVKVSLIGGVELTVPADARVTVRSVSIGGTKVEPGANDGGGPEIAIHNYGILGGVKVARAQPTP